MQMSEKCKSILIPLCRAKFVHYKNLAFSSFVGQLSLRDISFNEHYLRR